MRAPPVPPTLPFTPPTKSEFHAEADEHLPRIAVEGGDHPLLAEAWNDVAVGGAQRHARRRIDGEELVARRDVTAVGQVLPVEADRIAVVGAGPDEVRVEQGVARLVEERARRLELEGLAAPGGGCAGGE